MSGQASAVLAEGQLKVGQLSGGHDGQHAITMRHSHRDPNLVGVNGVVCAWQQQASLGLTSPELILYYLDFVLIISCFNKIIVK